LNRIDNILRNKLPVLIILPFGNYGACRAALTWRDLFSVYLVSVFNMWFVK